MKDIADFNTQKMHMQMHGKANFHDVIKYRELLRNRRINAIFWVLFVISLLFGWLLFNVGFKGASYYILGLGIFCLFVLIIRYGLHKNIKLKHNKKNWERLREVPNWVVRRMKRKRTNKVNGRHHVYKREGNVYYRKLK